ncbi:MAG: protein translocase subunit SecD [Oscillospiraceae bacterium]|nr:protein translocase subunit SecD [Oscillospiraceae bacterium]
MKRIPKPVFFIVAILILLFSYTAIFGVSYYTGDVKHTVLKGITDIRWGIDIQGGVEATFVPADDVDATDKQLDSAKAIIETRMISSGITDYELYTDSGTDSIIVRFPWKEDEKDFNAQKAIEEISTTAKLTFRPGNSYETTEMGSDGNPVYKTPKDDTAEILMDGSAVDSATSGPSQEEAGQFVVNLELTSEGAKTFAEITEKYNGQIVSIWMDDEMLSAPTIKNVITDGKAVISGNFDAESSATLANQIEGGALPFALKTLSYGEISPTLGENSLIAMAYAGIIAIILIALFMIFMYRLPGLVAVIALLGQVGLSIAAISRYFTVFNSFTMTLPGIAGIILSIGMGVDANIITAERIKEEFKAGKTLDGAIDRGTKNSLSAIIDGNMTVIIVSIILLLVFGSTNILSFIFGASTTGTIYAFGYTLLMGVISNFIMGVFFSRVMLKSVCGIKAVRRKGLFGGGKNNE